MEILNDDIIAIIFSYLLDAEDVCHIEYGNNRFLIYYSKFECDWCSSKKAKALSLVCKKWHDLIHKYTSRFKISTYDSIYTKYKLQVHKTLATYKRQHNKKIM